MSVSRVLLRLLAGATLILGMAVLPVTAQPLARHAVRMQPPSSLPAGGVANTDNDNERNCDQYDDNDNDVGNNLVKDWLQGFCEFEEGQDAEISSLNEFIGEVIEVAKDTKPAQTQAEVDAKRAQVRSLVRGAIEARLLARAGQETTIALAESRVALKLFPNMPQDLTVTVRYVDARDLPPTPGPRVGPLALELRAQLPSGIDLSTLPAEAHLSARYSDEEASALDKSRLVLARLNPTTGQWEPASKAAGDPAANYVSATIVELGTFVIYQR